MSNWSNLKASVAEVIKTNGNQEITGQILQNSLSSIISNLGENATFAGIATPTTNPGVPDGPVFYLAIQNGTYSNFGGFVLENNGLFVLYNNSGEWEYIDVLSNISWFGYVIPHVMEGLTLEEAVNLIPSKFRKTGLVFRFVNKKYQFEDYIITSFTEWGVNAVRKLKPNEFGNNDSYYVSQTFFTKESFIYNADNESPVEEGYHTLDTAIATVPDVLIKQGLIITFKVSSLQHQSWIFISDVFEDFKNTSVRSIVFKLISDSAIDIFALSNALQIANQNEVYNLYSVRNVFEVAVNNADTGELLTPSKTEYANLWDCRAAIIPVEAEKTYVLKNYNLPALKSLSLLDVNRNKIDNRNSVSNYSGSYIQKDGLWTEPGDITITTPENCKYIAFNVATRDWKDYYKFADIQLFENGVSNPYNYIEPKRSLSGYVDYTDLQLNEVTYPNDFNCRTKIKVLADKKRKKFIPLFDIHSKVIKGNKTVYISPDGEHSGTGLLPSTAVKTIADALALNPSTIVFLPGTYTVDINYFANEQITVPVNLIGYGEVIIDNLEKLPIQIKNNAYIENIHFKGGINGALNPYLENDDYYVACYKCKFTDSKTSASLGGFRAQGGNYYIVDCEASDNYYDGFNYHEVGTYIPHILEIGCKGYMNGIGSDYYSQDGSTIHAGAKAIRVNCDYGYSQGGVIADVNPNTVSVNIGCTAYSSLQYIEDYEQFNASFYCSTNAVMYLIGCNSHGSKYDLAVESGGTIYVDTELPSIYNNGGAINNIAYS